MIVTGGSVVVLQLVLQDVLAGRVVVLVLAGRVVVLQDVLQLVSRTVEGGRVVVLQLVLQAVLAGRVVVLQDMLLLNELVHDI